MSRNTVITLCILILILLVVGYFTYQSYTNRAERNLLSSEAATLFVNSTTTANFTDFDGNDANLDQFLGQTLIVNSWASWAPSSVTELQLLTDTAKDYADRGVVVIGINRAETKSTAEAFLATLRLTDQVVLIVDTDDKYYKAIGGYTMPETVIYDTTGAVIAHKRGTITAAELNVILSQTLSAAE